MARNTNTRRPQVDLRERDTERRAPTNDAQETSTPSTRNGRAQRSQRDTVQRHEHRTAKIVELIGSSHNGFEDAVKTALADAAETTRGITGCQVEGFSVKCENGEITEYKASIKVAFGVERT